MALPGLIEATGFAAVGARDLLKATGPIPDHWTPVCLV
jgi:hypothetical protein